LLEHAGHVVTREELRQSLWSTDTYVEFDGSLNAALKRLRYALGDSADNPIFVETLPKRGYRFLAPVAVEESASATSPLQVAQSEFDVAPPGAGDESTEDAIPGSDVDAERVPWRQRLVFGLILALLAVLGVASYHRLTSADDSKHVRAPVVPSVTPRVSVAVIGFNNLSGRSEDAWLSTALSEMLSTELAAGDKLRLVSGEDVAHLRMLSPWMQTGTLGQSTSSRIGLSLSSDVLVLGSYSSVGKAGKRQVRVDVRLQEAATGNVLTEVAQTESEENLFHLASVVGSRLRQKLGLPADTPAEQAAEFASMPSNSDATRLYSLGLVKLREYDYLSARGLFDQAVKADPKFSLAYSMLSRADIFLGHDDKAKAEAKRGLDLAANLSRVQRMEIEASYYHAIADRAKAAENYQVLFNLFPDSLDYGLQLTRLQLESYHPDEALETIRQLRRLPPPLRDDPGLDLREAAIIIRNDVPAAERLYHSAAAKAAAQGKKLVYAKAEQALCWTNQQRLQSPPECREAYETYLAAGDRKEAGACLQLMAEANRLSGHDVEAIPLYEQALRAFKETGSQEGVGVTLNNLALVRGNEGQWDRAERSYREAKKNFEAVNDWANTSAALTNIAGIDVLRGQLREAADLYRQSWELADTSGRARHEDAHIQYGSMLLMQGELKQARLEVEPQVTSSRAYGGDPWQLANALSVLADIQKAEGNLDGARKNYQEGLDILKNANASVAATQVSLGELSIAGGNPEAAEPLVRQAIAEFEKDKSTGDEVGGYTSLGRLLLARKKVTEARETTAHALKLADLGQFPVLNLPLQLLQARVRAAAALPGVAGRNDLTIAARQIRTVIQKSQQLGLYDINCEARLALGELELRLNFSSGRAQLTSLAAETRSRGLELIARQAEQAITNR